MHFWAKILREHSIIFWTSSDSWQKPQLPTYFALYSNLILLQDCCCKDKIWLLVYNAKSKFKKISIQLQKKYTCLRSRLTFRKKKFWPVINVILFSKLFWSSYQNSYQRDTLVWQSIIILALLCQSIPLVTVRSAQIILCLVILELTPKSALLSLTILYT